MKLSQHWLFPSILTVSGGWGPILECTQSWAPHTWCLWCLPWLPSPQHPFLSCELWKTETRGLCPLPEVPSLPYLFSSNISAGLGPVTENKSVSPRFPARKTLGPGWEALRPAFLDPGTHTAKWPGPSSLCQRKSEQAEQNLCWLCLGRGQPPLPHSPEHAQRTLSPRPALQRQEVSSFSRSLQQCTARHSLEIASCCPQHSKIKGHLNFLYICLVLQILLQMRYRLKGRN